MSTASRPDRGDFSPLNPPAGGTHKQPTPRLTQTLTTVVILLGALGTLFVWAVPVLSLTQSPNDSELTALLFIREDEMIIFDWLRENTGPDDVILASPRVGMFVPGQTGARSFYGHPFETIEAGTKAQAVNLFYGGEATPGETPSLLPPPDLFIYGPSERALGEPANLARFAEVFAAGDVAVYRMRQEQE